MKKVRKMIYVIVGCISLLLGTIGIALPVLPTVPFLILTSYCFARGSSRFDTWFKSSKIYEEYLESFVENRSMTLKQKICTCMFSDIMMAFPLIILDNFYIKLFIISIIIFKYYYFIFKIKTIR